MKYLIVGLGNVGAQYQGTRHNIGFDIIDEFYNKHLSEGSDASFVIDRHALKTETSFKGRKVVLIKPTTFMNLSGKAVHYWMQQNKVPIEHCLILLDDLALPFGSVRIKASGSDAGHNGLKSIQETLGHNKYPRLRFGIGADFPKGQQSEFVLGKFSKQEQEKLPLLIDHSVSAIESFVFAGISTAMNQFNLKP